MPYRGLLEVYSVHWRHSQQPPAHWTVCPLTDQTFVGVSLASVHAPGLSCRHVTKSAHRASGYQISTSCNMLFMVQWRRWLFSSRASCKDSLCTKTTIKRPKQQPVQHAFLTARHSVSFAQGSSHQPSAWTGELPLTSRSEMEKGAPSTHNHHGPDTVAYLG